MFAHPVTESVLDGFTPRRFVEVPTREHRSKQAEKQSFIQDLRRPTAGGRIPNGAFQMIGVVPVERIELPTFGLQNRCSTAELNRRTRSVIGIWNRSTSTEVLRVQPPKTGIGGKRAPSNIRLVCQGLQGRAPSGKSVRAARMLYPIRESSSVGNIHGGKVADDDRVRTVGACGCRIYSRSGG